MQNLFEIAQSNYESISDSLHMERENNINIKTYRRGWTRKKNLF